MQDNSELFKKLAIRQRVVRLYGKPIKTVADCYAGEGVITSMLWSVIAESVICIEKDQAKLASIRNKNVTHIHADNQTAILHIMHCDIFDCDAYGLVMPFIKKLAAIGVSKKWVVFTDGTPEKARKVFSAYQQFNQDCRYLFSEYQVERSNGGNAYYGYGLLK